MLRRPLTPPTPPQRHAPAARGGTPHWLIPGLLMLLGVVPALAGFARLAEFASGGLVTEANARFMAAPLPVVLHILAVLPFSLLGAWQLSPAFRQRHPRWHQAAGRWLVVCGLVAALSGLWMAHFYPWPKGDGLVLYGLRLLVGAAMVAEIWLGLNAIRQRRYADHGAWMLRAYALGMGAGTQVLTHMPYFVLMGTPAEGSRAVLMGTGWLINVAVAEWVIRRRAGPRQHPEPAVHLAQFAQGAQLVQRTQRAQSPLHLNLSGGLNAPAGNPPTGASL